MQFVNRDLTDQFISLSYQDVLQQYVNTGSLLYVLDGYGNVVFGIQTASLGNVVITSDMTSSMTVLSASYSQVIEIRTVSSSFASSSISSSFSNTASYAFSASISQTSSYSEFSNTSTTAIYSDTASTAIYADYAGTASLAAEATTASYVNPTSIPHNQLGGLQGGDGTDYYHLPSASAAQVLSGTSSYALTASYAMNGGGGGTSLQTGSSYPITSSWAINALSTNFAVVSQIANTASYATLALSASWAPGGTGTSLTTGSTYPITASHALTASYIANMPSGSTVSASYALTASYTENQGIAIPRYDFSYVQYEAPYGQFSKCTYRVGGVSGSIVCIVDAYYNGSLFIGVSKSLG